MHNLNTISNGGSYFKAGFIQGQSGGESHPLLKNKMFRASVHVITRNNLRSKSRTACNKKMCWFFIQSRKGETALTANTENKIAYMCVKKNVSCILGLSFCLLIEPFFCHGILFSSCLHNQIWNIILKKYVIMVTGGTILVC